MSDDSRKKTGRQGSGAWRQKTVEDDDPTLALDRVVGIESDVDKLKDKETFLDNDTLNRFGILFKELWLLGEII